MKIKQITLLFAVLAHLLAGCNSGRSTNEAVQDGQAAITGPGSLLPLTLPTLAAVPLEGRPLQVLATTSIIGDVVAQVGGQYIQLTTLMAPEQDPHSYEPGAQELTAVATADVIFVNGWGLEEALVDDLTAIGGDVPLVPISANITPLPLGAEHEDEADSPGDTHEAASHNGADPHVWFSVPNVIQWAENAAQVLGDLDPANTAVYEQNAATFTVALENLQIEALAELAKVPPEKRLLVTNHDTFGYFAEAYDFTVIGTIIPAASTLAEPSARDLTALIGVMQERGLCTLFTETTISDSLAQTIVAELDHCPGGVQVLPLYTGAVGAAGSYSAMFRANVDTIVQGLGE